MSATSRPRDTPRDTTQHASRQSNKDAHSVQTLRNDLRERVDDNAKVLEERVDDNAKVLKELANIGLAKWEDKPNLNRLDPNGLWKVQLPTTRLDRPKQYKTAFEAALNAAQTPREEPAKLAVYFRDLPKREQDEIISRRLEELREEGAELPIPAARLINTAHAPAGETAPNKLQKRNFLVNKKFARRNSSPFEAALNAVQTPREEPAKLAVYFRDLPTRDPDEIVSRRLEELRPREEGAREEGAELPIPAARGSNWDRGDVTINNSPLPNTTDAPEGETAPNKLQKRNFLVNKNFARRNSSASRHGIV